MLGLVDDFCETGTEGLKTRIGRSELYCNESGGRNLDEDVGYFVGRNVVQPDGSISIPFRFEKYANSLTVS